MVGDLDEDQVEFSAGEHKFEISYALASTLPTSFKCKNGSIKYKIRVIVDRSWKPKSRFEFPFTVIRPLNLNDVGPSLRNPLKQEISKDFKMDFTTEPLYISASIPTSGFVPGEVINVDIQVNNQSKTHIKELKVYIKKLISLNSDRPRRVTKISTESDAKVSSDSIPISSMRSFEINLEVPSLEPNISNCDVIQVQYELRIKAKTSGLSRSPRLNFPITIGTVPLRNQNDTSTSPNYFSLCKN